MKDPLIRLAVHLWVAQLRCDYKRSTGWAAGVTVDQPYTLNVRNMIARYAKAEQY